jgi:two-component system sensor histidine kinase YesM
MKRQTVTKKARQGSSKFKILMMRIARAVTDPLNNLNLRKKFILMCVICVLLPIVVTDTIFFSLIFFTVNERQHSEMKNTLASVERTLDNMTDYMTTAAVNLYTTKELYGFLDEQYGTNLDYLNAYKNHASLLHKVTFGNNTYISNVQLFCDNDTLINGGGVYRLDTSRESYWYTRFFLSGRKMAMLPSRETPSEVDKRILSFICIMDYNVNNTRERIIKLNLNYNYFLTILNQQYYDVDVYICDSEQVLFSTTDPNKGTQGFIPLKAGDFSDARYASTYDMFGDTWSVYLYPKSYLSTSAADLFRQHGELFFVLVIINMLLPGLAIYFINRSITQRLIILGNHLQMVKDEKYAQMVENPTKDEIGTLIENYNLMVTQIQTMIGVVYIEKIKQKDHELAKQRAELHALHSQINPHFIFNALESIRMRSLLKQEKETAEVIELLAVLMRKSTDWGDDCVTLTDEVSFAEAYLKMQQYRFGSRISYKLDIHDDCLNILLPKLTLVTFVENACVHGVEGVGHNCMVLLSAEKANDSLNIYIEDTGAGMTKPQQEELLKVMRKGDMDSLEGRHSVGIMNACLRLRKYFGDEIVFEIDSEPNAGTCITIRIPLNKINRSEGGSDNAECSNR